jgi:serine phosphatase RsbU (regulator of sigma subunit)
MVSGKYLLETVYGDRIPLGMHLNEDHVFTQHRWKLEKESSYYLFTDGYSDQFNGATGKKFLKKNMRRLILDIQNFHMSKQKEILEERLVTWMGKSPQTDDIMMIGIRIE